MSAEYFYKVYDAAADEYREQDTTASLEVLGQKLSELKVGDELTIEREA